MDDKLLKQLCKEEREEYQIPPFFKDEALQNLFKEGDAYLRTKVKLINYDEDLVARSILKNQVFYAFHKKLDEFESNYSSNILGWQFSKIERSNEDE